MAPQSGGTRSSQLPGSAPNSDVAVSNNLLTVQGIATVPFKSATNPGVSQDGYLAVVDPNGRFISWVNADTLFTNRNLVKLMLNKLIWNPDGTLVYDANNTLTLEP